MFKIDVLWQRSGSNEVEKEEGGVVEEFPCSGRGQIFTEDPLC